MCEKFRQLLATGQWFPPSTPVPSNRKLISSSSFHHLDMTLAVAQALNPNEPPIFSNILKVILNEDSDAAWTRACLILSGI